ncbi:AsmA family protein [Capnocytophaga sp.]|uniref:AsmA family protein n=1 Tax=Capnocytophaga sp. TaxID=44737 RepID=UPI0026DCE283|nr:AsmA family protein [Capnocytophaga sp.]MDO5105940.1 AsmA-like C-terminal region-containing protein [Capnocytophaga sp.]
MKKVGKIFKATLITLVIIILAMIAVPFLFKNTIKEKAIAMVNENINATASLEDVSISLFQNFPKASILLTNFNIINKAPFVGDTLFYAEKATIKLNIKDLLSGNYNILGFNLKNASALIHLNAEGKGNYDIALPSENKTETVQSNPLKIKIQSYSVDNMKFTFKNDDGNMLLVIDSIFHQGEGNFANEILDLNTKSKANISFSMDKSNFMNRVPISLDAVLGIDLTQQKYTFKENKAVVNRLQLAFNGFIQLLNEGQRYDLTFKTLSSSFQNFLALLPEQYSKSIENVNTTGNFTVNGVVKGDMIDEKFPTFGIEMFSENASLKYPDLPKTVRNINIDLKINNATGLLNDTKINLNKFTMSIDQDYFAAKANIGNIVENPHINTDLKGVINLKNLSQAYPVSLNKQMSGILKMDVSAQLDMNSVEKQLYQNIKSEGNISVQQFVYEGDELPKPFHINEAGLNFSPSHIELNRFLAKTGESDLNLQGRFDNLYGFLFKKEILKGNFNMKSEKLTVNDFLQPSKTANNAEKEQKQEENTQNSFKIPSFLDCSFTANAHTVVYDNLQLKNVSGKLIVKDEKVLLENLKTDLFSGIVAFGGSVSTKENVPLFDANLVMNKVNITEAFTKVDMLSKIAPIANVVQGLINTKIDVNGKLTNNLTPDLNTISGELLASLVDSKIKSDASPLLSSLNAQFSGLNLSNLNLKDQKASVRFENGKVKIEPFTLKYKDIAIEINGMHGFDQTMDYRLVFNVPPQMLGNEASSLLSRLTPENQKKIENIPVIATVGGTFKNPKVSTDMKQAATNLASQIAAGQINNLKNKGTEALSGLLSSKTDSTTAGKATQMLDNLVNKNKDSLLEQTKTQVKEEAKKEAKKQIGNFLKGLGGSNEKKE